MSWSERANLTAGFVLCAKALDEVAQADTYFYSIICVTKLAAENAFAGAAET